MKKFLRTYGILNRVANTPLKDLKAAQTRCRVLTYLRPSVSDENRRIREQVNKLKSMIYV